MYLTKEQAVEEHRKMWRWVAVETNKQQKVLRPEDYLKKFYSDELIFRSSFCCEYAKPIVHENCNSCPIDWKSRANRHMCVSRNDDFDGEGFLECWFHSADWGDYYMASNYAARIAELPEKDVKTKKINNTEKPPIGVAPYFVSSGERINALAEAIQRYSTTGEYEVIKLWAKEIICHCVLLECMARRKKLKNSENINE